MLSLKYSILLFILLAGGRVIAADALALLHQQSVSGLEQRLKEIDQQLNQLARYSLDSNIRATGYRSENQANAQHPQWIEVDFGSTVELDEVVLVPCIRRDENNQFQPDAFPAHLRLIAGSGQDRSGQLIAEFTRDDPALLRIAPLIIPCGGIEASWIRVEAVELSLRTFDENYVFQLAEIMAFSRNDNMALRRTAQTSSASELPAWSPRFATDGFIPYLMNAAEGGKSVAYLHRTPKASPRPQLTIDLGQRLPISQINLHAVDLSDSLPQPFASNFGIPEQMMVLGANRPDFSDAIPLFELQQTTIYETGPIMNFPFAETACRYIRLHIIKPTSTELYGGFPEK